MPNVMLICALVGAGAWEAPQPITHAEVVAAALADARKLDPITAQSTRYLTAHHLHDPAKRGDLYLAASYHVNSVSRGGFIKPPRRVTPWLWAIDLSDYLIDPVIYGRPALSQRGGLASDPYFHAKLTTDNKNFVVVAAPWLPTAEMAELIRIIQSEVPIYRADWWIHRTGIQEGRDGFGYYDLLGLKTRDDVDVLSGLNRKIQAEKFAERIAKVKASGVATAGEREVVRFQATTGGYWFTKDVSAETLGQGNKNPLRFRFEDYAHEAEEIVFTLPNGLPGYYLSNNEGVPVASAPPDIAADHRSTNNDRRVHASMSCIACHKSSGLIPFDDWERKLIARGNRIRQKTNVDKNLFLRIQSAYIREIKSEFDADVKRFSERIAETGVDPRKLPFLYQGVWSKYLDAPLTPRDAAYEVGLSEEEFLDRLKAYASKNDIDLVLADFIAGDPEPIYRTQWEELFPLVMQIVGYPGVEVQP